MLRGKIKLMNCTIYLQIISNLTMVYNDTTMHSLPVILNTISNALAKMAGLSNLVISTFSEPWPNLNPSKLAASGSAFMGGMFIGMAAALIPAGFGVQVVKDRVVSFQISKENFRCK